MPRSPVERKADFARAHTLREVSKKAAAKELRVSWTHLVRVFEDPSQGGVELKQRVARYVGVEYADFWGEDEPAPQPVAATA